MNALADNIVLVLCFPVIIQIVTPLLMLVGYGAWHVPRFFGRKHMQQPCQANFSRVFPVTESR